jgi:hypothetical protein
VRKSSIFEGFQGSCSGKLVGETQARPDIIFGDIFLDGFVDGFLKGFLVGGESKDRLLKDFWEDSGKESRRGMKEDYWKEFREAFLGSLLGKHERCLKVLSVKHVWNGFWEDSWKDSWTEIREDFGNRFEKVCW